MSEKHTTSPAYVAYSTLKKTIQGLAPEGELPTHIDHSVLRSMSGSARSQFVGALRFFGLIDEQDVPAPELRTLAVSNDQEWKSTLKPILEKKYTQAQFEALKSGTPKSLRASFEGVSPSLVDPATRFLIKAAEEVGISVGAHIKKNASTSSSASRSTARRTARRPSSAKPRKASSAPTGSTTDALLEKFPAFDPKWDADQQKSWFDAYQKLIEITKSKGGDGDG